MAIKEKIKSVLTGTDPSAALKKIAAAEAEVLRLEHETTAAWKKVEAAFELKFQDRTQESEDAFIEADEAYRRALSNVTAAKSLVAKLNQEHESVVAAEKEKAERQRWTDLEKSFPEMLKLAEDLDAGTAELCRKYVRLNELRGIAYSSIPKSDGTIYNASPMGESILQGHLQLAIRKGGKQFSWAKAWENDEARIPSIRSLVENSKGWALKNRPTD